MAVRRGRPCGPWQVLLDIPGCKPSEPCLIRSPDGKQLLCIMRENNRAMNSWIITSDDEGRTWSKAYQAPAAVSGDRHDATYGSDGRLLIAFRDTAQKSPTRGHFVGWVGTYEDLLNGREGHYCVKLLHSYAGGDCGYAAVERLPDDTCVATTYVKYRPGAKKHSTIYQKAASLKIPLIRVTVDEREIRSGKACDRFPTGAVLIHRAKSFESARTIILSGSSLC